MALLTNINGKFSVSDVGAVTFNNAFTFPTTDGAANYVLQTNGSGQLAWALNGNGDISGSGDSNYVTKFTGAKTIGNGPITFSGTGSVNSTFAGDVSLAANKHILIGNDTGDAFNADSAIRIQNTGNAYVQIKTGNNNQGGVLVGDTADDYVGGFIYNNNTGDFKIQQNNVTALTISGTQNATFAGTVTAPTFLGDLNGTINTVTTATTKGNSTNDTTVATTAFVQNVIGTIPAGLVFQGTWNAATNTPTLTSGSGITGNFYIVSVAGSTNLDGITDWQVGDWAVFIEQGASDQWEKIDNSSVLSGSGTGGSFAGWSGSGTSVTLGNAPVTFSGNNSTFPGTITIPDYIYHAGDADSKFGFGGNNNYNINLGGDNVLDFYQTVLYLKKPTEVISPLSVKTGNDLRLYRSDNATYARFNYAGSSVGLDIDDLNGDGINLQQAGVNKLRIETNGNATFSGDVGIGGSPTFKLDVLSSGSGLRLNSSDANGSYVTWSNNGTSIGFMGSGYHLWSSPNNIATTLGIRAQTRLDLGIQSSVHMTILSSGNVGIGTVSPTQKLEVHSTIKIGESGVTGGRLISGDSMIFQIDSDNNSNTSSYRFRTNGTADDGTELMRIQENGSVGIGTVTPGTLHGASYGYTKLHVDGGTDRGQMIIEGDSFAGIVLSDNGATANQRVFATSVDDTKYTIKPLADNGSSTAQGVAVTVLHGGNVGIGTTTPNANLQVQRDTATANVINLMDVVASIGNNNSNPGNHYPSGLRVYQGNGTMGSGLAAMNIGVNTNSATTANGNSGIIETPIGMTQGIQISARDTSAFIRFNTGTGERMRISSGGLIKFNSYGAGTLVTDASGNISVSSGGGAGGPYLPLAGGTLTGNLIISTGKELIIGSQTSAESPLGITIRDDQGNAPVGIVIHNENTGTSADAQIAFETQGAMDFSIGLDRSDSNKFVMSRAGALGTNNVFTIDGTTATFTGDIKLEKTANTESVITLNPNSSALGTNYQWNLVGGNSGTNYAFQIREGTTSYLSINNSAGGNAGAATFAGDVSLGTARVLNFSGTNLQLFHDGSNGLIINNTGDLKIQNTAIDKDIIFRGRDGASTIDALTLDMSNGGSATFRDDIDFGGKLTQTGTGANTFAGDVTINGAEYINQIQARTGAGLSLGNDNNSGFVFIDDNSNVGISTTSPDFKLQIQGGTNTEETVLKLDKQVTGDTGGHTTILAFGTETGAWAKAGIGFERTGSYDRGKIHFLQKDTVNTDTATLSDSVMTIDSSGNVGIGTTTPGAKLQVKVGSGFPLHAGNACGNVGIGVTSTDISGNGLQPQLTVKGNISYGYNNYSSVANTWSNALNFSGYPAGLYQVNICKQSNASAYIIAQVKWSGTAGTVINTVTSFQYGITFSGTQLQSIINTTTATSISVQCLVTFESCLP